MFGEHVVRKGLLTRRRLLEVLEQQETSKVPVGRLAIQLGLLSIEQVVEVLGRQSAEKRLFGELAVDLGEARPHRCGAPEHVARGVDQSGHPGVGGGHSRQAGTDQIGTSRPSDSAVTSSIERIATSI